MAGINNVIGFVLSFMVLTTAVVFFYINIIEAIDNQSEIQKSAKKLSSQYYIQIDQEESYYGSDRLKIYIKNAGINNALLKENKESCIDIFLNERFLEKEMYKVFTLSPLGNYYLIEPNEDAVIEILTDTITNFSDINVKLATCAENTETFYYLAEDYNWLDNDYNERAFYNISNTDASDYAYEEHNITLNSSNFNFSKAQRNSIRILLPVFENTVLDSTFDEYNQRITDHSKYNQTVFLGASQLSAIDDPLQIGEGAFFGALNYDGIENFNYISQDSSLQIESQITMSAWIKWNGAGNETQYIFRNGRDDNSLRIINDGGVNNGKVEFTLNIASVPFSVISNSILDSNWHHIVGTYNSAEGGLNLYIDGIFENSSNVVGLIEDVLDNNYIGKGTSSDFFNGSIDDVKVLNIALNSSQVQNLYRDRLTYIPINYTTLIWNDTLKQANLTLVIPYIRANENYNVEIYYNKTEKEIAGALVSVQGGDGGGVANSLFISIWDSSGGGYTPPGSIGLPLESDGIYNFNVSWGDGSSDLVTSWNDIDKNHSYSLPGLYTVTINGTIEGFNFYYQPSGSDNYKIQNITQWGSLKLGNRGKYFFDTSNLDITALDTPNLDETTNLSGMFQIQFGVSTLSGNGNFSWDVSGVTDMNNMFSSSSVFNGDISSWNVSSVTNMSRMFRGTTNFNGDISNWVVSSVTDMSYMFSNSIFSGDLRPWNVSGVTNMKNMFSGPGFTGNISSWDVSSVTDMSDMFSNSPFNGNISAWDVSNVNNFGRMFYLAANFNGNISHWHINNSVSNNFNSFLNLASSFDQNLGSWNISNTTIMNNMFSDSGMSSRNYSLTLMGWQENNPSTGATLGATNINYEIIAADARNDLINTYSWTINDAGLDEDLVFSSTWDTTNTGVTDSLSVGLPLISSGDYNFTVVWGDGNYDTITSWNDPAINHSYSSSGTYDINITGIIEGFRFNDNRDENKLLGISSWGPLRLGNDGAYFRGAVNFDFAGTDDLNLTGTTNLSRAFDGTASFNGDLSGLEVNNVADMSYMFFGSSFNSDIRGWDVKGVTDMGSMFQTATSFDWDLGSWNVTSVGDMTNMFTGSALSDLNYSSLLIGWNELTSLQSNVQLDTDARYNYTADVPRQNIIDTYTWTINDGGQDDTFPVSITFYLTADTAHDLGVDGVANQGTSPPTLAQLINTSSGVSSACIQGGGGAKSNAIQAQQYTAPITSKLILEQNVSALLNVYSSNTNAVTWDINMFEYNNITGNVRNIGFATNLTTATSNTNLGFIFNNSELTLTSGNIIKFVVDVTTSNGRPLLCYGLGTQSLFDTSRR